MRDEFASERGRAATQGRLVRAWLVVAVLGLTALPLLSTFPRATAPYTSHAPIHIDGDANFTPANGVTGGSGTPPTRT